MSVSSVVERGAPYAVRPRHRLAIKNTPQIVKAAVTAIWGGEYATETAIGNMTHRKPRPFRLEFPLIA